MSANARRGEIAAFLGGRERRLVLTLGALAELETAFGVDALAGLGERFSSGRLSARDLAAIIGAGLRGAGETITDTQAATLAHPDGFPGYVAVVAVETITDTQAATLAHPDGFPGYVAVVAALLVATFGDGEKGEPARP